MSKTTLFKTLRDDLPQCAQSSSLIEQMEEKYQNTNDLNKEDLLYWLNEAAFYTSGWEKKHEENGDLNKARIEKNKIALIEKAIKIISADNEK